MCCGFFLSHTPQLGKGAALCSPHDPRSTSCHTVLLSTQGFLLRPIPNSALGCAFYLIVPAMLLLLPSPWDRILPMAAISVALLASCYLIYVMARVLRAWCKICLATHAVNVGLALLLFLYWCAPTSMADVDHHREL